MYLHIMLYAYSWIAHVRNFHCQEFPTRKINSYVPLNFDYWFSLDEISLNPVFARLPCFFANVTFCISMKLFDVFACKFRNMIHLLEKCSKMPSYRLDTHHLPVGNWNEFQYSTVWCTSKNRNRNRNSLNKHFTSKTYGDELWFFTKLISKIYIHDVV